MKNTAPTRLTLAQWRDDAGLTQAQFAAKVGAQQSQICRYETGVMWPSMETAVAIENVTNGLIRPRDWVSGEAVTDKDE